MPGPVTKLAWPESSTQPSNLVEVITDGHGTTHAEHGICQETWRLVPKYHRRTGDVIGTEAEYGRHPCGQPGLLTALTHDADDDHCVPVYTCPHHS